MPSVLRRSDVERETGLKRSTIYELMARGEFPKPIRLTGKSVGWLAEEILAFIHERTLERDNPVVPKKRTRGAEARGA